MSTVHHIWQPLWQLPSRSDLIFSFAQRGLRNLVEVAIRAVRRANDQGLQPAFCATGGFKAEIAFLNLLGALLNIEIYYIHDQFREIVRLPKFTLSA